MPRSAAQLPEYGAKNGTFASHRWLAGNTAVPFNYGFDAQLEKTVEFLRAGNYLNVDIFALKKTDSDKLIAPLGRASYSLASDDTIEAVVVIQNKNIGIRSSLKCVSRCVPNIRLQYCMFPPFARRGL